MVSQARGHLSEYRRNADLISIGAYRAGSDPRVDRAIAMREPLKTFLTQESSVFSPLAQAQNQLSLVLAMAPPATV